MKSPGVVKATYCVLFLLFAFTFASCAADCVNDCSGNGSCVEDVCECEGHYEGEACELHWRADSVWNTVLIIYTVYAVLLQTSCFVFGVYQLGVTFIYSGNWTTWTVVTYLLILTTIGCFIRIIGFILDPHGVYIFLPNALSVLVISIPVVLWLAGGYMLFVYWIELQLESGISQLNSVKRLRPLLFVLIGLSVVITFPLNFLEAFLDSPIFGMMEGVAYTISFVILIVLNTVYGIRLRRTMKHIFKATRISNFKIFLNKLTKYVFMFDALLIASILTILAHTLIPGMTKWRFISTHALLRLEEFGLVLITLLFVAKKKPKAEEMSTSRRHNSGQESINLEF